MSLCLGCGINKSHPKGTALSAGLFCSVTLELGLFQKGFFQGEIFPALFCQLIEMPMLGLTVV